MSLWLVAAGLLLAPQAAPTAWCDSARAALAEPVPEDEGWKHYAHVVERFEGAPLGVLEASRLHTGEEGELARALTVLRGGVLAHCRAPRPDPEAARARTAEILRAEAFEGEREQPDLIDQLIARFQAWVLELLESEGMQRYAEGSRFVYLTLLVLLSVYVALRLTAARRRRQLREEKAGEGKVERSRVRNAQLLMAEAREAHKVGAEREAIRLGFLALLARLGEHEPGAVTPSKTSREILVGLSAERRRSLADLFRAFDELIYRQTSGEADARAFLAAVEGALKALT